MEKKKVRIPQKFKDRKRCDHLRKTYLPAEWKTDGKRVRENGEKLVGMLSVVITHTSDDSLKRKQWGETAKVPG